MKSPPLSLLGKIMVGAVILVAGGLSAILAVLRNKDDMPGPTAPESQKRQPRKRARRPVAEREQ